MVSTNSSRPLHHNQTSPRDQGKRRSGRSRPKRQTSQSGNAGSVTGEGGHTAENSSRGCDFDTKDSNKPSSTPYSVMDILILVVFSVLIGSGIVLGVYGYRDIMERFSNHDLTDVLMQLLLFAGLIGVIMYILVRLAAHYIVYLGIGVFLNLIFATKPDKAKSTLKSMFEKS